MSSQVVVGEDEKDISFHMGELFDSYEELEDKLEKYSKRSFVHYWRRDSRTVNGAHMKTARPICEKLKYYSVKYACIYGGQKFLPRGAGRRQSQSIRTNCPAHIMLRASKDGTKLEVTGVNTEHNHEISEETFKNLPQERKLSGEIKQEVQDLMQLHIDRKRLKEYVRLRANKNLRSKDLFNIAAANKKKRKISQARVYELYRRMEELEKLDENDTTTKPCSDSEDDVTRKAKRIKKDISPWGQDELTSEMITTEVNDCEDGYGQLTQEEVVDDMDTTEGQLLESGGDHSDMIDDPDGEIVGEMVMDGDPSVIVDSIVNVDGSSTVYVDEQDFNNYCNNHLDNSDHHEHSSLPQALEIGMIHSTADIDELSKTSAASSSSQTCDPLIQNQINHTSLLNKSESNDNQINKIWLLKNTTKQQTKIENNIDNETKSQENDVNEIGDVVFSEEASHQLLIEQLAVLRAEKGKLHHETEMLKIKKDKLKLQMNCYTNEIEKQQMEKEKLRLQIELLRSKFVDSTDDISHYIFVP